MGPFFVAALEPFLKGSFICGSDSLADNLAVKVIQPRVLARARAHAATALCAWRRPVLAALLLAGLTSPAAWGGEKRDHERARAAVQAGQVLPLTALLERLQQTHPGQVLELELERDDGRWIYEVKLLQADGQLLKLDVDAATGQVLKVKARQGSQVGPTQATRP
jgi:uncharacterized membrane protein YkoI